MNRVLIITCFLQYVWEKLYQPSSVSGKEVGTLYFFRQLFRLTNVRKSVKKNYASCESLMLSTTNAYICSAFMEWADHNSLEGSPQAINILGSNKSIKERKVFLETILSKFVEEYVLIEFDKEKALRRNVEDRKRKTGKAVETETGMLAGKGEGGQAEVRKIEGIVPGKTVQVAT